MVAAAAAVKHASSCTTQLNKLLPLVLAKLQEAWRTSNGRLQQRPGTISLHVAQHVDTLLLQTQRRGPLLRCQLLLLLLNLFEGSCQVLVQRGLCQDLRMHASTTRRQHVLHAQALCHGKNREDVPSWLGWAACVAAGMALFHNWFRVRVQKLKLKTL